MARPLRMHCAGAFYHVLSRGNERRTIFRDGTDYGHFLDLLGGMSARFGVEVWSYVLMGNHFHLILRPGETPLSGAMHWLGVAYSVWHNRRHERSGHLYQGRFKAFAVEAEGYLERLICYVHRNPVRAGVVARLADYPWSSYAALGYGRRCPAWLARDAVLRLFGGRGEEFRRAVQAYSDEDGSLWEDLRGGAYLGSESGMARLWAQARVRAHREVPGSRPTRAGAEESVEAAVMRWARALSIAEGEMAGLLRPVRGQVRPLRDVLIHAVWSEGEHGLSEIGRCFGVGYTSIVNARLRATEHLAHNRRLSKPIGLRRANDK